jgi:hypothetical protein
MNILNWIIEKINPKHRLNEKEELILEIVTNLCNQSDTDFPIPTAGSYYLVNRRLKYWVKISDDGVSITNHKFAFMNTSIYAFKSMLIDIIEEAINKNKYAFEVDMFDNEVALLQSIVAKVNSNFNS